MSAERPVFPRFFITDRQPCPYLDGKMERKVFTHLTQEDPDQFYNTLNHGGFRRSQMIAYKPACDGCSSCVSIRIPVDRFQWSRRFRRIWKRNRDISSAVIAPEVTQEHYALFSDYVHARHGDGGMSDMSVLDFSAMVEQTNINTELIEYRIQPQISLSGPESRQGDLVALALSDRLADGFSMVYSVFTPDRTTRSLGNYMILDHIERARKAGLPFVYLGFWVENSPKMDYKSTYLPQERLSPDGWIPVADNPPR